MEQFYRGSREGNSHLLWLLKLLINAPGKQKLAEVYYALHLTLVEHIDNLFDHDAVRLVGRGRQCEANGVGSLWHALTTNLIGHQFQQISYLQLHRVRPAFAHPRAAIPL